MSFTYNEGLLSLKGELAHIEKTFKLLERIANREKPPVRNKLAGRNRLGGNR